MRHLPATVLILALVAGVAPAHDEHDHDEERRELGAHVHGEGALNIAISGTEVLMELEAPGADIVGFEHAAETEADRAAVEEARATLSEPLALFQVAEEAGCSVREASVDLIGGAEHAHADEHGHEEQAAEAHDDHAEATHTEFHAEYVLDCEDPSAIRSIDFAWFEAFPNAGRLDVTVVAERGQAAYEVSRETPLLSLDGTI